MKKIIMLLLSVYALSSNAQSYYSFSKSTSTYSYLTGTTTLLNGTWTDWGKSVKLPFAFKFYNVALKDSFYFDDYGSLSIDTAYNEDFVFFGEDLNSRGANLSEVSYVVTGTAPSRIFKLQFRNAGLFNDAPLFADSINCQLWLYETSNILEVHYGPGKVNSANWSDNGIFVGMFDPNMQSFMIIQEDPANPTVNTTSFTNAKSITGMPASGMVYRFTPSQFQSGINNSSISFNIIQNKISLPQNIEVKEIKVINMNGQVVQSAKTTDNINLGNLPHGVYLVTVDTKDGMLSRKLVW